jgi:hypothetical protein
LTNVDPITCLVKQTDFKNWIRYHKEYRLENSNIYELCARIREDFEGYYFYVTGDASGMNSSAMVRDNLNYYMIIMQELKLQKTQMKVPSANPLISNNRPLVNSVLEKFPSVVFDIDGCKYTIEDLIYCEVDRNGDIDKKKDKHKTHLLDCFRYDINTWHSDFVKYRPLS